MGICFYLWVLPSSSSSFSGRTIVFPIITSSPDTRSPEMKTYEWRTLEIEIYEWRSPEMKIYEWRSPEMEIYKWQSPEMETYKWRNPEMYIFEWRRHEVGSGLNFDVLVDKEIGHKTASLFIYLLLKLSKNSFIFP